MEKVFSIVRQRYGRSPTDRMKYLDVNTAIWVYLRLSLFKVFTEQGSSASQMTAAKVMDIISRLPGCDGQAADAVSAYTQVKNGGCTQIIGNSQIGMSRHLDSSTTTQMAKIMVQYGRPSRSSGAKSVRSSFSRTIMGKAIRENPFETWLGKSSELGMFIR